MIPVQDSVKQKKEPQHPEVLVLHDSMIEHNYREIHFARLNGWKFSSEDDPEFSSPDYDDSGWYRIPIPPEEEGAIPDSLWKGFGWYRLKVKIDTAFSMSHTVLQSYGGVGAIEFYINDSLVLKRGNPAPLEKNEKFTGTPATIGNFYDFVPGETYQLAFRNSFHNHKLLGIFTGMPVKTDLGIHMYDRNNLDNDIREKNILTSIISLAAIILFMVTILHLLLYLKLREEKSNLYIFLITGALWLFSLSLLVEEFRIFEDYNLKVALQFLTGLLISFFIGFVPFVLHKILKVPMGKFWKFFVYFPVTIILLETFISVFISVPEIIMEVLLILIILASFTGGIIAMLKAKKRERKDLYLLAGSILGAPVIMILAISITFLFDSGSFFSFSLVTFLLLTILPVGLSLYQGKNFLQMHRNLDQMVQERTRELEEAYQNLEESHQQLKDAQGQLIQQEKLASLGQLTAGIAHEIKNPLNFVNNFSEVCLEMIDEAKEEIATIRKGHQNSNGSSETLKLLDDVNDLLSSVASNLKKIYEHGHRADGIVKSMLLHSRGGSGKMEEVHLNALVREYVNLAYHGMRAGKKPIDVDIEFDLDLNVGEVKLVGEDFSRVIVNLCNNAFDAMREKLSKTNFKPLLKVKTVREEELVKIKITDNGPGIPEENMDKILQPFFTTKKGTEGTGLGLSISHDIVKAHGGEIEIESVPQNGSTITIVLQTITRTADSLKNTDY
ncbi:hypothetical protein GCM10010465_24690 [Actinomadura fibrosa]